MVFLTCNRTQHVSYMVAEEGGALQLRTTNNSKFGVSRMEWISDCLALIPSEYRKEMTCVSLSLVYPKSAVDLDGGADQEV